ncbi:glucosyl hydrolase [Methylobacterium radiotolerans]|uniref:glucosyl hydrolase n=1 Tax=Methylobacterium TaxID=407 RepID=UPI002F323863
MIWEKLGVIYNTDGSRDWMHSHPYLPTAIQIDRDTIRLFLAFRDTENVGRLGFVDVAASDPRRVIRISERPSLDIGVPGAFDDNGVSPLSVVRDGNRLRMYYAGWQLTPRARYLLLTGLAFSDDNGETFTRHQLTPVLERSSEELLVRSGAAIIKDGDLWKAWYAAGSSIITADGKAVPTYYVAYAESADGITWPTRGRPALMPEAPDEYGFGRPHVERAGDEYRMWYSIRTHSKIYRIGYGTSPDGIHWTRRDDEVGITASASGWDSEMIGFASIVENEHGRFMFYNGNDYGSTGVGVARWAP